MNRKRRILIASFLNYIPEKCIGRQGKTGAGRGTTLAILTVSILQATHGGKGRNFLTGWKGEDLNYKFPLLYPGRHVEEVELGKPQYFGMIHRLIPQRPQINANEGKNYDS
jgi:hypothetical protein